MPHRFLSFVSVNLPLDVFCPCESVHFSRLLWIFMIQENPTGIQARIWSIVKLDNMFEVGLKSWNQIIQLSLVWRNVMGFRITQKWGYIFIILRFFVETTNSVKSCTFSWNFFILSMVSEFCVLWYGYIKITFNSAKRDSVR